MTLPVIGKVFGWVISTSVSTCEIEVWDEVKRRPCSTLFFSCLCSWMFPMIVLKVPWSARGRPNFRQKSQVQYCYPWHPLTIQKTGLPISPCARSQVLLGPNSSFCCLNHLKSQKKSLHLLLLLGLAECQGCGSCRPRKLKSSKGNWFWTSSTMGWIFLSN